MPDLFGHLLGSAPLDEIPASAGMAEGWRVILREFQRPKNPWASVISGFFGGQAPLRMTENGKHLKKILAFARMTVFSVMPDLFGHLLGSAPLTRFPPTRE